MTISNEVRQNLIQTLAVRMTDAADMDTLIDFFHEYQIEYLDELDDEELLSIADDYEVKVDDEEEEEVQRLKDEKNGVYPGYEDIAN